MSGTLPVLAAAGGNAALACALLLGLGLVGHALVPSRLRPRSSPVALAAALSVGAAAVGWGSWVLGSLAGTRTLVPFWLAALVLSLRSAPSYLAALRRVAVRLLSLARSSPLLAAAALAAALPVVFPLATPLVDNDGIRYHVALPKLYLLTGRVFLYRWDVTGGYPALGDALYLLGLVAGSPDTAKFLHAGFLAASVALLALTLHRGRTSRGAAFAGPLLLLASPAVGVVAGAGFIDHIALFHVVTAFVLVFRRERSLLVGLALGAALATKLTVAPAVAALALAHGLGRPKGRRLGALAAVGALSVAVLSPFLVRNAVGFGDPVFPVGHLLAKRPLPGVDAALFSRYTTFNRQNAGPLGIVWTTPANGEDDETAGIHVLAGIVLLAFGLRDRLVRHAALVALPLLAYAALSAPPTRYLLPMLWGLSLAAAAVLPRLWSGRGVWLLVPLALPGVVLSWSYQARHWDAADYLRGWFTREEFLGRTIPGYRAAAFVNGLPPGGVMAGDFPGPVYLEKPWIVSGFINDPPLTLWIRDGDGAERLLARLRETGTRWLLAPPGYGGGTPLSLLPYAPDPSRAAPMAALRARLRLVATVDGVDVWEVPPAASVQP